MALGTPTLLTKGDDTTTRSSGPGYTTASITPTANACVLLAVVSGTNVTVANVVGCNLTWASVDSQNFNSASHRLSLWRGFGASPTTGTLDISYSGGGASGASWIVAEVTGTATGGTNGSAAIVQTVKTEVIGAASGSVNLAAFTDAANIAYAAFAVDNNTAITPEVGYTELDEQQGTVPGRTVSVAYRMDGLDLTPSATWASTDGAVIAVELTAGVVAGQPMSLRRGGRRIPQLGVRRG